MANGKKRGGVGMAVFVALLIAGIGAAAGAAKAAEPKGEPPLPEPGDEPEPELPDLPDAVGPTPAAPVGPLFPTPKPPPIGGFDTPDGGGPVHPKPTADLSPAGGDHIGPLLADTPTQGMLYQVVQSDNPSNVARRALDSNAGNPRNCPFIKRLVEVTLNRALYSKLQSESASGWPKSCALQTNAGLLTIGQAFLPRNEDLAAIVADGDSPEVRSPTDNGEFTGEYGLIWIPFEAGDLEPPETLRAVLPTIYA